MSGVETERIGQRKAQLKKNILQQFELGAIVYRDACATCHGVDGSGAFGPNLLGKGHKFSYDAQRQIIERGRRSMPGFGASLSEEEIQALLAHVRVGFFEDTAG